MRPLQIEYRSLSDLKPNPKNPRLHSEKQIHQVAASIRAFGFNTPLMVDSNGVILAGHCRYEAAKLLGVDPVPTVALAHLNEARKLAFAIADNKIALNSSWDDEMLKLDVQEIQQLDPSFEMTTTGFDTAEIDLIVDGSGQPLKQDPADVIPKVEATAVSQPGDLWVLGEHALLCGDALDPNAYAELMGQDRARTVFTDPPYNVPIEGHVSGLGAVKHREFEMASGEMSSAEFADFLGRIFSNMAELSVDGAMHFICMDWRHLPEMLQAAKPVYSELKNLCVWNKTNGGMGSLYRSKHELVFVYKVGTEQHVNNVNLGKSGRYRTNVWDYAGVNSWRSGREADLNMHPTVKPTALVIDAIKDCSHRGDIVLDPCVGSGTTIMAAEKCSRQARAIEIDPLYVDVAIRRWQQYTGKNAQLDITGETFDEAEQRRTDPLQ